MHAYLAVALAAILGAYALNMASRALNRRAMAPELPQELHGFYDADRYRLSQQYARDGQVVSTLQETLQTGLLVTALGLGWFNWLDVAVRGLGFGEVFSGLFFFLVLGGVSVLLSLPFEVYDTFVLEERYGFNRTTPVTFALDRLKGWALTLVLGGAILAAVMWFFGALGSWAWLVAWGFVSVVTVVLQALGPRYIMPLFNTFTPLEEGELRAKLEEYAASQGFELDGIFVMDGSKRSSKGNAFFSGFGPTRRIALYDTLIEEHTPDEILAVLAHEVGHSKKGHIWRMLVVSVMQTGAYLALLQLLLQSQELYAAFGMEHRSVYAGLFFFALLLTPLSLALSVLGGMLSRRHEYEADAFAAATTGRPKALADALKRLSATSLANLTPHRLSVLLHYSHPPVLERVRALGG